jgi:hypothetical protein
MTRSARTPWLAVVLVALGPAAAPVEAGPEHRTVAAWDQYVAATEARLARELASTAFLTSDSQANAAAVRQAVAQGQVVVSKAATTDGTGSPLVVPDATVQHWRGLVLLRNVALNPLLRVLQHPPEHGPFQQDVLALTVLRRQPDVLDLFIRISRTSLVTVTYDTEHHVEYHRHGAARASSRSVATRIVEVSSTGEPAEDRGYLWRLNSYWKFQQVNDGVLVEMESLTLSRGVPSMFKFVVEPVVDRIARESVERTMATFRDTNVALLLRSEGRRQSEETSRALAEAAKVSRRRPSTG